MIQEAEIYQVSIFKLHKAQEATETFSVAQ